MEIRCLFIFHPMERKKIANSYTVYVPYTSENDPDSPGTAGDPGGMGEPDLWKYDWTRF